MTGEKPKKKFTQILKILGVIFVLIFIFEIWIANRHSVYGEKIAELKQAKANLELENQLLENAVFSNASLAQLEKKATQMLKFETIKNIEYVKK